MSTVTVIDYGVGNLLSVVRAFEHFGAEVILTDSTDKVLRAEHLVLPGVGAFADGMSGIRERGLVKPIKSYAGSGRPFLGICLGMQMMLDFSEEFGFHEGLGLIPGKVAAIPITGVDGNKHKIPHIGWNKLIQSADSKKWEGTILNGLKPETYAYFVHSYTAIPALSKYRLADCMYNGRLISAVIKSGSAYGCQFHPEKSGIDGLKIISNFLYIK